ncbi:MAG: selenide, water dikinase SelD, partial [Candidatus Omnitrophica bacterium]|nr:selenide, water dikinase SelD [Candidatus Omnitrophota bacterium]
LETPWEQIAVNEIFALDMSGNITVLAAGEQGYLYEIRKHSLAAPVNVAEHRPVSRPLDMKVFPKVVPPEMDQFTDIPYRILVDTNVTFGEFCELGWLLHQTADELDNAFDPHQRDWRGLARVEFSSREKHFVVQLLGPHRCATDEAYREIFGSEKKVVQTYVRAARLLEHFGVSAIDINSICIGENIRKCGGGSGLLNNVALAGKILRAVTAAVKIPVGIKFPAGYVAEKEENLATMLKVSPEARAKTLEMVRMSRESGAAFVILYPAIFGTSYDEKRLDLDLLKEAKSVAGEMKIIGNGCIGSPEKARRMMELTEADSVMIGRASIGNIPWIFRQSEQYLSQGRYDAVSALQRLELAWKMVEMYVEYRTEVEGLACAKRHITAAIKHVFADQEPGVLREHFQRRVRVAKTLLAMKSAFEVMNGMLQKSQQPDLNRTAAPLPLVEAERSVSEKKTGGAEILITLDKNDIGRITFRREKQGTAGEIAAFIYDLFACHMAQRIIIRGVDEKELTAISEAFNRIDRLGTLRERVQLVFGRALVFEQAPVDGSVSGDVPDQHRWSVAKVPALDPRVVVVGVNIGSTYSRCVVMRGEEILFQDSRILWNPTVGQKNWARPATYDEFITGIEAFIRDTIRRANIDAKEVGRIGVGTVGLVRDGQILTRANVTDVLSADDFAKLRSFGSDLSARLGRPVSIEMDNKVAALGERCVAKVKKALVVKLGTAMACKDIDRDGNITSNYVEFRHILVGDPLTGYEAPKTGVRGTLRAYGTCEAFVNLTREVLGVALPWNDLMRVKDRFSPEQLKKLFVLNGQYWARGFVKGQVILGYDKVILSGKNLQGPQGALILEAIRSTIANEFPSSGLTVEMSQIDVDYAVAVGAAYMAAIEQQDQESWERRGQVFGLSREQSGHVRRVNDDFGITVLPSVSRSKAWWNRFTGRPLDLPRQLFRANQIIEGDYFENLHKTLAALGRQELWATAQQIGTSRVEKVLGAIRRKNIARALEQLGQSLNVRDVYPGRDAKKLARLERALRNLFRVAQRHTPEYFEDDYVARPRLNIEVCCQLGVLSFEQMCQLWDGLRRMWAFLVDQLFGISAAVRRVEHAEAALGERRKGDAYTLKFFRRNDKIGEQYTLHPYTRPVNSERQAVSLATGISVLCAKIMAKLERDPNAPVIVRINGRPGNRKSHLIRYLKEGLKSVVSKDEIALIEVNDYKVPDAWFYDSDGFDRDFQALRASGRYKVILIEGTILELYQPREVPAGDFSVYIESAEHRRMEYLLNGDDKERLEYFLRYQPYHNILMRYRTDILRPSADVIIDTYLCPEKSVTSVTEDRPVSLVSRQLSEKKYFPASFARQNMVGQALGWLMANLLVAPSDMVRLNLFRSPKAFAGQDIHGLYLAERILTDASLTDEERRSVVLVQLYLLLKSHEFMARSGFPKELLKKQWVADSAALWSISAELQKALAGSGYSLEHFLSGMDKLNVSADQKAAFLKALGKDPQAALEYVRSWDINFNPPLFKVDLKSVDQALMLRTLQAALPTPTLVNPAFSLHCPLLVRDNLCTRFSPVTFKVSLGASSSLSIVHGKDVSNIDDMLTDNLAMISPYLPKDLAGKEELLIEVTPLTSQVNGKRIIAEYIPAAGRQLALVRLHPILFDSQFSGYKGETLRSAVLFDEIVAHHVRGLDQDEGDRLSFNYLRTLAVPDKFLKSFVAEGIVIAEGWKSWLEAVEQEPSAEQVPIQEFIGPLDEKNSVRFTMATLQLDPHATLDQEIVSAPGKFVDQVKQYVAEKERHPVFALSILALPESLDERSAIEEQFLTNMVKAMDDCQIPVVGGHTVASKNLICTLILVEIIPAVAGLGQTIAPVTTESAQITEDAFAAQDSLITDRRVQGCAAKYPADKLQGILKFLISKLPQKHFADLRVKDDVVLFNLDDKRAVAFTVDVIKPMMNSAPCFGRVAMVHAASDLYAKGITPRGALGIMYRSWANDSLALGRLTDAAATEVAHMGAAQVGQYTVGSKELFFGGLLYGVCRPEEYISNSTPQSGDLLVLTKPIGTGAILYVASTMDDLSANYQRACVQGMLRSNAGACKAVLGQEGIHAVTDVTGFGLV